MKLRNGFRLYLIASHALFIISLAVIYRNHLILFFILEACLFISLFLGLHFHKQLGDLLSFLQFGAESLAEANYADRFREVGQEDMDRLIQTYNGMLEDLRTERLRAGEQRGFLEKLLEATPQAILAFDYDDRIAVANAAATRFFRCDREQLLGKACVELDHPLTAELANLQPGVARVLAHGNRRRFRCLLSHFFDRGFKRGFLLIEDLTVELHKSQKSAYEKLIRAMSHEINNSIGATSSLLETCKTYSSHQDGERSLELGQLIDVVLTRLTHLNAFMREYADMVRLPKPKHQPTDLIALLRLIEMLHSAECRDRSIAWVWEVNCDPLVLPMDKHQMEQVFTNIVKNAIEAIETQGTITIRLCPLDDHIELAILDSAGALDTESKDQLFTPFFTTKDQGQGIGLMLVGDILVAHGYDFSLDSQKDGQTCFTIHLPLPST